MREGGEGENKGEQSCLQKEGRAEARDNSMKEVWTGMKNITGYNVASQTADGDRARADDFNLFFKRFDSGMTPVYPPMATLRPRPPPPSPVLPLPHPPSSPHPSLAYVSGLTTTTGTPITFTLGEVRMELKTLQPGKAAGPDGITPGIIRLCADELCGVLMYIYNLSMSLERPPALWKMPCVIPVPKKGCPRELNDYTPVALTSHFMKVLERLVLSCLRPLVEEHEDPLQFGYQANIGVDDAIVYLLHRAHSHLEVAGSALRLMFCDFSSAFNTIQPARLSEEMLAMQVDGPLVAWTNDYLTNILQYVRLPDCVSGTLVSSTGAPDGTALAPFLFNVYTSDYRHNSELCHLQKFADVIVGCVRGGQEGEYRGLVRDFAEWCCQNQLRLNIKKTKEMVIDFKKERTSISPVSIGSEDVEIVQSIKYLGVHIKNKLDWSENTLTVYKKGQSHLHFLRKLCSFDVQGRM